MFTFERSREQTPPRQSLCWRIEVLDVETWEETPPSCLGSIQIFNKWNRYHCLRSSLPVLSESRSIENKLHLDSTTSTLSTGSSMLKHSKSLQTLTLDSLALDSLTLNPSTLWPFDSRPFDSLTLESSTLQLSTLLRLRSVQAVRCWNILQLFDPSTLWPIDSRLVYPRPFDPQLPHYSIIQPHHPFHHFHFSMLLLNF
jgi:hypothetical protein